MTPTARLTPTLILSLFNEALTHEFGWVIPIEAAYHENARYQLHQALRDHPERDKIMICAFPEAGEFWFVKKTVEVI